MYAEVVLVISSQFQHGRCSKVPHLDTRQSCHVWSCRLSYVKAHPARALQNHPQVFCLGRFVTRIRERS